jgi:hypothetical protein
MLLHDIAENRKNLEKKVVRKWKTERSEKKDARRGKVRGRNMLDDF